MMISRSCSFCREMNPASERYCRSCHHEAHVARLDCQCPRCTTARRRAANTAPPVPLPAILAAALAALRARAEAPARPEDRRTTAQRRTAVNADNANTPDTAPVTRKVTRTPVSAKLADIIRALDDTLMAEHGAFAFAYAILVGDGLAGASNARDGFVPPIVATVSGGGN